MLDYVSPYGGARYQDYAAPYGILWDRDRWYLIGRQLTGREKLRFWRADRVITIASHPEQVDIPEEFSTQDLLNRKWLDEAMAEWASMSPVVIRMTRDQAERLKRDWYYAHAHFEDGAEGDVIMTFGENNRLFVFELLRWLGPGAELIAPHAWREAFVDDLRAMIAVYEEE
jgi:predicted DNA-binding transcriptional regulator YafY